MQVATIGETGEQAPRRLLARLGLTLRLCEDGRDIPGSYWGAPEAGLIGDQVYARADTPVHSLLHEACHYLCMPPSRRRGLHTDAGGDYAEENSVCFMQIVLAAFLPGFGQARMLEDMDAWGYTFRLGSAAAWFHDDSADARAQLQAWGILDAEAQPTWLPRGQTRHVQGDRSRAPAV